MINTMDICSLMHSLLVLAEVKDKNQGEGKQCMSSTELWEIFLTSYTETVKMHRSVATILNQNQCIPNRQFYQLLRGQFKHTV